VADGFVQRFRAGLWIHRGRVMTHHLRQPGRGRPELDLAF
jgi:hypothetical protein